MSQSLEWSEAAYRTSVSSRCWTYTPYGEGWAGSRKHGADLSLDGELQQIVGMESQLRRVPDWAQRVVERSIDRLPGCGHYLFPLAFLEALDAIGSETPPTFVHGCFTADRGRKTQMMDYVFCLDAWLAGASPQAAAAELVARSDRKIDWHAVCTDLWNVLGNRTELKELLVERLVHNRRFQIKTRLWDDDLGNEFGRDHYLGDYQDASKDSHPAKAWSYVALPCPDFNETTSPRVRKLEEQLAQICPDWNWFHTLICEFSWLCAPKEFRYLEGLLWCIGKERPRLNLPSFPLANPDEVPRFLRCEDTYPDQDQAAVWWQAFLPALEAWWQNRPQAGVVADDVNRRLGEHTAMKHWLVRLYRHKLWILERLGRDWGGTIGALVNPRPGSRRGTRPLSQ